MIYIDLETYSSYDLKSCGVHKYVESPDFDIICAAVTLGSAPAKCIDLKLLEKLLKKNNEIIVAHNAEFERQCLNEYFNMQLPPERFIDTASICAYLNVPVSLKKAAEFFDLDTQKMNEGSALIRKYCMPNKKGERVWFDFEDEDWETFTRYCETDVDVLVELHTKMNCGDLPEREKRLYCLTARMNDRGVDVDLNLLGKIDKAYAALQTRGNAVADSYGVNLASPKQLKEFAEKQGVDMENTQAATITKLLETLEDGPLREVLEARQMTGNASLKKLATIKESLCEDGRVRDDIVYYGATSTGRWSGKKIQLQNLIRSSVDYNTAIANLEAGKATPDDLTSLIRPLFTAPAGEQLCIIDYSQIEAVVASYLTGDVDTTQAYLNGVDLHTRQAELMYGTSQITKDMRQKAKTANFSCVYGGGPTAVFKAAGGSLSEDDSKEAVSLWRQSNPKIVGAWKECERALTDVITGRAASVDVLSRCSVKFKDGVLVMTLPSGRHCLVHGLRMSSTGIVDADNFSYFGGKMFNVFVQGTARDVMADAMLRLEEDGYDIITTVHDEVVLTKDNINFDDVHEIFTTMPWWASGLKIKADGGISERYNK